MFIISLEICYNMNTRIIERVYFGGYMENLLTTIERENHIREIFLSMFKEEGISQQELEKAICESYCEEGFQCESIKDIPINEMKEAIIECCESAGLAFQTFDDILEYFYKNNN